MLIIPIGHEDNTVRRLPWVTFAIMAACFVTQILVSSQMANSRKALEVKLKDFLIYSVEHPYLEPDQQIIVRLVGEQNAQNFLKGLEMLRAQNEREPSEDAKAEQARFDELAQDLVQTVDDVPTRKYGYIASKKNALGLLTYMFIHGGWLHLLGNLLFLYLTGPFIEDVWGRPLYLVFYVAVGAFAAFMFGLHYPNINGPLVGASGAIAGVMGGFLVRYWKTKIEFVYFIFFFARGTFSAPAFVMLPLWFVLELFNAGAMDIVNPGGSGGVAHWAHVWGFVFGLGFALAIMKLKVEERHINPHIEAKITYVDNVTQSLENALRIKQERRFEEAFTQVLELARTNPGREDITRVLWGLSVELGRENEAAQPLAAVIEREIRRDQMDAALDDYMPFRRAKTGIKLSPAANLALARHLLKKNFVDEAREVVIETLGQLDFNSPSGLVLGIAEVAASLSPALARKAIELCLGNPEIPADRKQKLQEYLDRLPGPK
jgi:membrane associated rhomboid family serine protease